MPTTYRLNSPRSFPEIARWNLPEGPAAVEIGRRALRAGCLDPARRIFEAVSAREPLHPEIAFQLAELELADNRVDSARALLEALPPDFQQSPAVLAARGDIELSKGRIGPALRQAFLASEVSPASPRARFLMARLHWLGGAEREAELAFLSLVGEPEGGDRAAAWAVFCGWRQGHFDEVSALWAGLRTDDAVCEGLRRFGHERMGSEWVPSDRVQAGRRDLHAAEWAILFESAPGPADRRAKAVSGLR